MPEKKKYYEKKINIGVNSSLLIYGAQWDIVYNGNG